MGKKFPENKNEMTNWEKYLQLTSQQTNLTNV